MREIVISIHSILLLIDIATFLFFQINHWEYPSVVFFRLVPRNWYNVNSYEQQVVIGQSGIPPHPLYGLTPCYIYPHPLSSPEHVRDESSITRKYVSIPVVVILNHLALLTSSSVANIEWKLNFLTDINYNFIKKCYVTWFFCLFYHYWYWFDLLQVKI